MLTPDDHDETERLFNAPAEKRNRSHALQETFWARRLGVLTDQFGIPWNLNCEKPELVRRAIR